MNPNIKQDLIDKHLTGSLTEEEQQTFTQLQKEDADFANEVALQERLQQSLKGEKVHGFREALKEVDKRWEAPAAKGGTVRRLRIGWIAGLAAAAAIIIGAFYFLAESQLEGDQFASYFEPYPMVLTQRSGEDGQGWPLLAEATLTYNQQMYPTAAGLFEQLIEEQPGIVYYKFYAAVSHLGSGDANAAIPLLEALVADPSHRVHEQSRWYLALAYLRTEQIEKAKTTLEAIPEGGYMYAEAQEILGEI